MWFDKPIIFGRNTTVGTAFEDLNPYDQLTDQASLFATAAAIDISSSAAADDGSPAGTGAQTVTIYGVDSSYEPATQTITMNGQTKVVGTQTWKCVQAVSVAAAGSGRVNAGDLHVVKTATGGSYTTGVPGTLTSAICKVAAGAGLAGTGAYAVPLNRSRRAGILTIGASVYPGVLRILSERGGIITTDFQIDFNIGTTQIDLTPYDIWWDEEAYIRIQTLAASAGGKHSAALCLES